MRMRMRDKCVLYFAAHSTCALPTFVSRQSPSYRLKKFLASNQRESIGWWGSLYTNPKDWILKAKPSARNVAPFTTGDCRTLTQNNESFDGRLPIKLRTLPKGKYYVGDLCYVFDDAWWSEWYRWTNSREEVGPIWYHGVHLSFHFTAERDGEYFDQYGNMYDVDSCTIGCVALRDIPEPNAIHQEEMERLGNIFTFDEPFTTSYDDGVIIIGHVRIDTND